MAKPKNLQILHHEQGGWTDCKLLETTNKDALMIYLVIIQKQFKQFPSSGYTTLSTEPIHGSISHGIDPSDLTTIYNSYSHL